MKRTTIVFSAFMIGISTWIIAADDDLPKPQKFARYDGMVNRSPFAVATAVAAPAATPNFAKDLYVANIADTPDGVMVTIISGTDKNLKEYVNSKQTNPHGFSISNIEWSDKVGATKVTISKDGQFATLGFNQALLAQAAATAPAPAQPVPVPTAGNAAAPKPVTNLPRPAPIPSLPMPTPPPRVRGVIQKNPQMPVPPAPAPTQNILPEIEE